VRRDPGFSGDKLVLVAKAGCGPGTWLLAYDPAANTFNHVARTDSQRRQRCTGDGLSGPEVGTRQCEFMRKPIDIS
jgi:hypothetical protein